MEIDSQSYTSYDILEPLVLVRKLPAREIVTFNGITDRHAEADPVPRSSANSSRISTKISCLSPNALCGAIEPANRLEELVYSMAGVIRRMVYILCLNGLLKPAREDSEFASPVECTLEVFDRLKHLALGAHTLYYYTSETSKDHTKIHSIADSLPPNLESLRIYGYGKGSSSMTRWELPQLDLDAHISRFMEERGAKLPNLKRIEEVNQCILNAEPVEDVDNQPELEGSWPVYES